MRYNFKERTAKAPISITGKMPVPQRVKFLVGWASCPPLKGLLIMMPNVSLM